VSFTGALFEPVMRPLFRVPGCGSFPFMMSITSGYPVGSKIVADLYHNKMCSKIEAQRLLAFCSTSGPLFMIGAVGIGMFNMKESGIIIMISHYIGVLTVGILFRFYGYKSSSLYDIKPEGIKNALSNFKSTLLKEKRPIGLLLSNAVNNSISAILTVGGFIILFSVIIRLLNQSGIMNILSNIISLVLAPIGMHHGLSSPIASGLLEMTIGSKLISSSQGPLIQKISAISGIIAWSGFSIHAQVASMISQTDLKISIYILSKALHMFFSGIYSFLIIKLGIIPIALGTMSTASIEKTSGWMESFASSMSVFVFSFMIFIVAAIIIRTLLKLRSSITH
jgi:sporulation integral membrane protein YlbJ